MSVYKGKNDPLVCGSYRAIKLLDQPMKVLERVSIDNMQFRLMSGKGTTDAISICDKYKRNTKQRRRICTKGSNDTAYTRWSSHSGLAKPVQIVSTPPSPRNGAPITVLGKPAMRTRWMAGNAPPSPALPSLSQQTHKQQYIHHSHRTHNIGYHDNLTDRPRTTTGLLTPHKHTDPAVKVR